MSVTELRAFLDFAFRYCQVQLSSARESVFSVGHASLVPVPLTAFYRCPPHRKQTSVGVTRLAGSDKETRSFMLSLDYTSAPYLVQPLYKHVPS